MLYKKNLKSVSPIVPKNLHECRHWSWDDKRNYFHYAKQ